MHKLHSGCALDISPLYTGDIKVIVNALDTFNLKVITKLYKIPEKEETHIKLYTEAEARLLTFFFSNIIVIPHYDSK